MVALPQQVNTADYPDSGSSVLIPEGDYQAVILDSEMVENKAKTGHYLALKIVITQGQYAETEFTERLNLINPNQDAVRIAYQTLARISEAFGMTQTPADSSELHNKPLVISIKNKVGKDWEDNEGKTVKGTEQSEIKKYKAVPAGGVQAPITASPAPQQQAAAPVTAAQPAANPFAATTA